MIKSFIMLQNIFITDKRCSIELSIHQRNLKQLYSTVFIIMFVEQHIIMISEDHVTLKTAT